MGSAALGYVRVCVLIPPNSHVSPSHPNPPIHSSINPALVHHRYPLVGALALLVLALLFLGPVAQQALSALPPWKQTLGSMMGLCKQVHMCV